VAFGVNLHAIGLETFSAVRSADAIQASEQVTVHTTHRFQRLLEQTFRSIYQLLWDAETNDDIMVMFPSLLTWPQISDLYARGILSHQGIKDFVHERFKVSVEDMEASVLRDKDGVEIRQPRIGGSAR
jgi:hypothetical protein